MKSTRRIKSYLSDVEARFKRKWVPKIPRSIETYHLTLLTIPWTLLVLLFYFLTRYSMEWLWAASVVIVLQYITDLFDGAVGRLRGTGLVRWGYYMDHILDYIFLCGVMIGYSFLLPYEFKFMFFYVLALSGAFMTHVFLSFSLTRVFKISYFSIGPTEIRVGFIVLNTLLLVFGKFLLVYVAPLIIFTSLVVLIVVISRMQRKLWLLDMQEKRGRK